MTLAELEAAIGWLERNRLAEHLQLLDGDPRYAWSARKRGEWKPPVGRTRGGQNSSCGGISEPWTPLFSRLSTRIWRSRPAARRRVIQSSTVSRQV